MYWEDVDKIMYILLIIILVAGIAEKVKERKNDRPD